MLTTASMLDTALGDLAVRIPLATSIFHRLHLDYCCAGQRTLAQACAVAGIDAAAVAAELAAVPPSRGPDPDWDRRPLSDLINHLLTHYHEPLRAALLRLRDLCQKVAAVHGAKRPELIQLASVFRQFAEETECHLEKEERVLFPWILTGRPAMSGAAACPGLEAPIRQMLVEHESHGHRLAQMRALCTGFLAPEHACASWRALYLGLEDLERELMEHIHLENHVLFPRVLAA